METLITILVGVLVTVAVYLLLSRKSDSGHFRDGHPVACCAFAIDDDGRIEKRGMSR